MSDEIEKFGPIEFCVRATKDEPLEVAIEKEKKNYAEIRSEIAYKEAKEKGLVVVVPKTNELFIDIDSFAQYQHFLNSFRVFPEHA